MIQAYVLPKLYARLPSTNLPDVPSNTFQLSELADPPSCVTGSIDLILNVDVYRQLLRNRLRRKPRSRLIDQNTALRWIISVALNLINYLPLS